MARHRRRRHRAHVHRRTSSPHIPTIAAERKAVFLRDRSGGFRGGGTIACDARSFQRARTRPQSGADRGRRKGRRDAAGARAGACRSPCRRAFRRAAGRRPRAAHPCARAVDRDDRARSWACALHAASPSRASSAGGRSSSASRRCLPGRTPGRGSASGRSRRC